jgi:nucleotide-binding universal stress UspA family protein
MKEIAQIIVPVDLGSQTDKLVEFAIYMANKLSAKISFIHVNESSAMGDMMMGSPSFEDLDKKRRAKVEQMLADIVEDNIGKCPNCSSDVLDGEAVAEIVAYAEKQNADLIIISTHGTKGLEKILLGSVAERVVKKAPCPTMVINPFQQ